MSVFGVDMCDDCGEEREIAFAWDNGYCVCDDCAATRGGVDILHARAETDALSRTQNQTEDE